MTGGSARGATMDFDVGVGVHEDLPLFHNNPIFPGLQCRLAVTNPCGLETIQSIVCSKKPWHFVNMYDLERENFQIIEQDPRKCCPKNKRGLPMIGTLTRIVTCSIVHGQIDLVVQGVSRVYIDQVTQVNPFLRATVQRLPDIECFQAMQREAEGALTQVGQAGNEDAANLVAFAGAVAADVEWEAKELAAWEKRGGEQQVQVEQDCEQEALQVIVELEEKNDELQRTTTELKKKMQALMEVKKLQPDTNDTQTQMILNAIREFEDLGARLEASVVMAKLRKKTDGITSAFLALGPLSSSFEGGVAAQTAATAAIQQQTAAMLHARGPLRG
eukprot:CAMPEP_0181343528 /NCGR_PEP_ID=MMETSP1101-20121128/31635_1 /TAXON_ID=46948 /ORGANISM="Rhodomonas abbreviata, Strain Caron Lab Isolate" /LENGTH=330 /DNA_ID=CAMNT_0023455165 /DNA_START=95 /DNA_END=1083 /DNA_ORIENTATION=-